MAAFAGDGQLALLGTAERVTAVFTLDNSKFSKGDSDAIKLLKIMADLYTDMKSTVRLVAPWIDESEVEDTPKAIDRWDALLVELARRGKLRKCIQAARDQYSDNADVSFLDMLLSRRVSGAPEDSRVRLVSRRPARTSNNSACPVLFEDRSGEAARPIAEIFADPRRFKTGSAAVLVAHHPEDVREALLEYDEKSRIAAGATSDDVSWILGNELWTASRMMDTDKALLRHLKPRGVDEETFAENLEVRLDGPPLIIVIDFSLLAPIDLLPDPDPETRAHRDAVVRAVGKFIMRLRTKGHVGIVGFSRSALAWPAVRELVRSAPIALVAAPMFGAPASDDEVGDTRFDALGSVVSRAIRPLLQTNSSALRARLNAEIETFVSDQSAREADFERQLRQLVGLASRLEEAGFLDPAYRLEQFCRDAGEPPPDDHAGADLWTHEQSEEIAEGYVENISELPGVGDRILLTRHSGFDEAGLLRHIEDVWMMPQHWMRQRNRKSWLPLMLGILIDPDLDLRQHFESRENLKIGSAPLTLRATSVLARTATAGTLPWLLGSPLLLLATELVDPGKNSPVSHFLHTLLNQEIGWSGLILTVPDLASAPFLEKWFADDFASHIEARLRPLDRKAALALVADPAAAKQVSAIFAAPDHPLIREIGKPYVVELIEAAVGREIDLAKTNLFELVSSIVAERVAHHGDRMREAVNHELPALAFDTFRSAAPSAPKHALVAGLRLGLLRPGEPPRFTNRLLFDYFVAVHLKSNWTAAKVTLFDRLRVEEPRKWDGLFGETIAMVAQALGPEGRDELCRFLMDAGQIVLAHKSLLELPNKDYFASAVAFESRNMLVTSLATSDPHNDRVSIADALAHRDPRITRNYEPAAFVPLDSSPSPPVLARFPVTNSQYACFVRAGGYSDKRFWTREGWTFVAENALEGPRFWTGYGGCRPNYPVVGISFHEALAFCSWFNEQLPKEFNCTIPSARDWYRAVGIDGRIGLTEGNTINAGELLAFADTCRLSNEVPGGGVPIGLTPANPLGVSDLFGNVWQWCDDWFAAPDADDEPPSIALKRPAPPIIVHGGPTSSTARTLAALRGGALDPHTRADTVGFRILLRPISHPQESDS